MVAGHLREKNGYYYAVLNYKLNSADAMLSGLGIAEAK